MCTSPLNRPAGLHFGPSDFTDSLEFVHARLAAGDDPPEPCWTRRTSVNGLENTFTPELAVAQPIIAS